MVGWMMVSWALASDVDRATEGDERPPISDRSMYWGGLLAMAKGDAYAVDTDRDYSVPASSSLGLGVRLRPARHWVVGVEGRGARGAYDLSLLSDVSVEGGGLHGWLVGASISGRQTQFIDNEGPRYHFRLPWLNERFERRPWQMVTPALRVGGRLIGHPGAFGEMTLSMGPGIAWSDGRVHDEMPFVCTVGVGGGWAAGKGPLPAGSPQTRSIVLGTAAGLGISVVGMALLLNWASNQSFGYAPVLG